jgi:hypothetical protein
MALADEIQKPGFHRARLGQQQTQHPSDSASVEGFGVRVAHIGHGEGVTLIAAR